ADIKYQPPDRVGAAAAVIDELLEGVIARDALVLLEGVDEIEERVDGDLMAIDRLPQRPINGAARAPAVAVAQLGAELIEILERLLDVVNLIAQIIGDATEGVDVAEILSQPLRQEQGNDGEVFVMRLRQLARERLRLRRRVNPRKRLRDGGRDLAGTCRVQRGSWGVG